MWPWIHGLAQPAYRLHPPKAFFDSLPDLLAELVVRVSRCSSVKSRVVTDILRNVRCDVSVSELLDEPFCVIAFVGTQRDPASRSW